MPLVWLPGRAAGGWLASPTTAIIARDTVIAVWVLPWHGTPELTADAS